jgi:uncharacterized protein (TIGR02246 family)
MILVLVLLMAGCMQTPQTDLEGLKGMRAVFQSALDAKDPAAIAAIYTEDGALLPPNGETVSGRAAIEAFWTETLASGIGGEGTDIEVHALGDVGYTVGTFTATDADGASIGEGKYVEIWRHVDGKWQLHRAIWNSNLPLPAPEPEPEPEDEAEVADEV